MFTASLGIFLLGLLAAAAGGFVGAAIGANFAFALTGFCVLFAWGITTTGLDAVMGIDPGVAFNYIAFGPFMGPHITFAAGAAAAAYAANKRYIESGKDATSPLAGLGRPDVLLIGSAFGVLGYLIQIGISKLPWFGAHTDSVALTVLLSAIIARLLFGNTAEGKASLFNTERLRTAPKERGGFMGKWDASDDYRWLPYQETPAQFSAIGIFFGLAAAGVALMLAIHFPAMAGNAPTFAFGISAIIILFLIIGWDMPVQHHVTVVAGLASVLFFPILRGAGDQGFKYYANLGTMDSNAWLAAVGAILIGALAGWVGAMFGQLFANLWYNRGTTHIDPPASSIWLTTTLVWIAATLAGFSS
ncbi:hypothetical protein M3G03_08640 [Aestuariimicrobium sp. p3-SID1156]|uniref:hypothetical protein n=1 Tax=Aestuariimicrobium sp. p3-SID1156 TaxID=2916038 RepID=UPI00223A6B83|nr:hypothetical protein [Aestuariimicrobium sp. p3-SID1156]MCT1459603.1 hypothetical protein [Aestuariimicrobium sp. p3-SID1156]